MSAESRLGGRFTLPGTQISVNRMGYGAMQLAGPHVFGPPKDRAECVRVLRTALDIGVDHIDTADFYGPHVTNEIIREALYPYPQNLTLVTKVGAWRDDKGGWLMDRTAKFLRQSVEDNLRNLGLERLQVVNLRVGGVAGADDTVLDEPMEVMAEMQNEGLIEHIGLSTVSEKQYNEALAIAPVVCIQNFYNVANRKDDAFIERLHADGVAYVPYFPLGGFNPLQSGTLNEVAAEAGETPMAIAQAWLLHRSPNVLLIPGTSKVAHLTENLKAAEIQLSAEVLARLDGIASEV